MISGRMDRKITIKPAVATQNEYGEEITSHPESAWIETFAEVKQQSAREVWQGGKVSETDTLFRTRYMAGFDETALISFEGTDYEITGKPRELGRQDGLEIMAKART
jgi:SPP1 family predicted phage head-tail adaptor